MSRLREWQKRRRDRLTPRPQPPTPHPGVSRKRVFLRYHFILKMIISPRQARDRHRENSQKSTVFLQAVADLVEKNQSVPVRKTILDLTCPLFSSDGSFWNSSRFGWVTVRRRSTGEMPASLWTVRRGRRTTPSDGGLRWRGARCAEPVVASAACRRLAGAERLSCGCCQTSVPIRGQIQPSAMERGARLRSDPIKTWSPFLLSISI